MTRKNYSARNIWLAVLLLLAASFAGGWGVLVAAKNKDHLSKLPVFPMADYLEGNLLWSPTDFFLSGTLDNILLQSKDGQRLLLSVLLADGEQKLPVIYSPPPQAPALFRQQKIQARISVREGGMLVASDVRIQ